MQAISYTYTVCGTEEQSYYIVLHDTVTGEEAGYMRRDGTATKHDRLKQQFTTREQAGTTAASWGHTL